MCFFLHVFRQLGQRNVIILRESLTRSSAISIIPIPNQPSSARACWPSSQPVRPSSRRSTGDRHRRSSSSQSARRGCKCFQITKIGQVICMTQKTWPNLAFVRKKCSLSQSKLLHCRIFPAAELHLFFVPSIEIRRAALLCSFCRVVRVFICTQCDSLLCSALQCCFSLWLHRQLWLASILAQNGRRYF